MSDQTNNETAGQAIRTPKPIRKRSDRSEKGQNPMSNDQTTDQTDQNASDQKTGGLYKTPVLTPTPTDSTAHVLYRFFSKTGQLLYIGITMSPPERFKAHQQEKEWWGSVAGITLESYDNRTDLLSAERRAIQVERPEHNILHNNGAIQTPNRPAKQRQREWHTLIGQIEKLKYRTGWGCASIWYHINRGEYHPARQRLDDLLGDMSWFGSAAAEDILSEHK